MATGFIGGISTIGGIIYPLIYGKVPNIHMGYAVVALAMFLPFTIFFAIVFRRGWRLADVDKGMGTCQGFGVQPIIVATRKEAF